MCLSVKSHSLEILQILTRGTEGLTKRGLERIQTYLTGQIAPGGGFQNRRGSADLYYTAFGLALAQSLSMDIPMEDFNLYLRGFQPEKLSFVDLTCLVKCRTLICFFQGNFPTKNEITGYISAIEKFYPIQNPLDEKKNPSPYDFFLALNIYQDLGLEIPHPKKWLEGLEHCRTKDGLFHHPQGSSEGTLLSTLAAILVIRQLTGQVDSALARIPTFSHPIAGFRSNQTAPLPDVLSTGLALFTLRVCGHSIAEFTRSTERFILDHWDESGGFLATLVDDLCDCEYTYYGLLALGAVRSP